MTLKIQFLLGNNQIKECIPDKIRLTRSLNQETGTILLTFAKIFSLDILLNKNEPIIGLYLIASEFFFFTREIRCIWKKGKPILIQVIFLIDKKEELNLVLTLFTEYAKNKGLTDYKLD